MPRKNARKQKLHEVVEDREPIDVAMEQLMDDRRTRSLKAKFDTHQKAYYEGTKEKRVSIVDAGAGTGKTTVAFVSGLEELRKPQIAKLMYVRFIDDRAQSLGFLPGDTSMKEAPYFNPAFQTLEKLGLQREAIQQLTQRDIIEFTTNVHMRGSDYENMFVIIDEAQNARDIEDLRLTLTRFHDSCKVIIIGHSKQVDSKLVRIKGWTPFEVYQKHLLRKSWVRQFDLQVDYRGELCRHADRVEDTIAELETRK